MPEVLGGWVVLDPTGQSRRTAEATLGGALTKFGMEYSSPRLRDSLK
jgi:hypothetical protein